MFDKDTGSNAIRKLHVSRKKDKTEAYFCFDLSKTTNNYFLDIMNRCNLLWSVKVRST